VLDDRSVDVPEQHGERLRGLRRADDKGVVNGHLPLPDRVLGYAVVVRLARDGGIPTGRERHRGEQRGEVGTERRVAGADRERVPQGADDAGAMRPVAPP
jgi:hypothetical protein